MDHEEMLKEVYRLSLENNKMLHKMRRSAFWGGLIKLVLYAAFLIVPIWLYYIYMAPMVDQILGSMQQVQGTAASAGNQLSGLQDLIKQYQSLLKGTQ